MLDDTTHLSITMALEERQFKHQSCILVVQEHNSSTRMMKLSNADEKSQVQGDKSYREKQTRFTFSFILCDIWQVLE